MRVALAVHQFLPRHSSGSEVITLEIARALRSAGHEPTVLTAEPFPTAEFVRAEGWYYQPFEGFSVYRLPAHLYESKHPVRAEYRNRRVGGLIRELLEQLRPDVLHMVHGLRFSSELVTQAKALGLPIVYTATDFWGVCHNYQLRRHDGSLCRGPNVLASNCVQCHLTASPHSPVRPERAQRISAATAAILAAGAKWLPARSLRRFTRHRPLLARLDRLLLLAEECQPVVERQRTMRGMLKRIDRILAPSPIMREMLVAHGANPATTRESAYGMNTQYTRDCRTKTISDRLRVGYTGQIAEHKGVHILVEAVVKLRQSGVDVELQLWGDATQAPEFTQRLRQLAGDDPAIQFRGGYPNPKVGEILASIDVLVVPSMWYENSPLVVYQALDAHTPVIATDLGGMTGSVKHGANGLTFPRGDSAKLAEQIGRLVREPGLYAKLKTGIGPVKDMAENAAELLAIYRELAA